VKQEEFGDTVVEAGLEVAELALLVLEEGVSKEWIRTTVGSVASRVSGLKARVESMIELYPESERVRRVRLLVARLSLQVGVGGAGAWTPTEDIFKIEDVDDSDEDSDTRTERPGAEREAKKRELQALFSRKVPSGS